MNKKLHIKKGDIVAVISGKHKPVNGKYTTGEVLQVLPNSNRVVVKGVNIVTKHNRFFFGLCFLFKPFLYLIHPYFDFGMHLPIFPTFFNLITCN